MNLDHRNKCLSELLRGEISAQESYQLVLEKVGDSPASTQELKKIHDDHVQAADILRREINRDGGLAAESSGVWGSFAKVITGTAKIFGNKAALKALKEGEEHGYKNYQKALEKNDLPMADRMLIETQLLPLQMQHIQTLDRFLKAV